jgi:hypothetical protein
MMNKIILILSLMACISCFADSEIRVDKISDPIEYADGTQLNAADITGYLVYTVCDGQETIHQVSEFPVDLTVPDTDCDVYTKVVVNDRIVGLASITKTVPYVQEFPPEAGEFSAERVTENKLSEELSRCEAAPECTISMTYSFQ